MDLTFVELLWDTEEHFGIKIPDDADVFTVGALTNVVARLCEEHAAGSAPPCRTSRAFYYLRQSLIRATGLPRSQITPSTLLADLVPRPQRRVAWEKMRNAGFVLPSLVLPRRVRWTMVACCTLPPFVVACLLGQVSWPLLVLAMPALLGAGFLVEPLSTEISGTVGDVARTLEWRAPIVGPIPVDEIDAVVRRLVSMHFAVAPERVTPETRFFGDLL